MFVIVLFRYKLKFRNYIGNSFSGTMYVEYNNVWIKKLYVGNELICRFFYDGSIFVIDILNFLDSNLCVLGL